MTEKISAFFTGGKGIPIWDILFPILIRITELITAYIKSVGMDEKTTMTPNHGSRSHQESQIHLSSGGGPVRNWLF